MNYWKHSLLSKKKFDGAAEDYLDIHKFIDSGKLFYFDIKHRVLLHNTYGIDICVQKFGDTIINSKGKTILVRDIAAEHCKEDLMGVVPALNNWFKHVDDTGLKYIEPLQTDNEKLKEFVLRPFIMSGINATLMITHSNFGIYLVKEVLGIDLALELAHHVKQPGINEMLRHIRLNERWQYTPDLQQLKNMENEFNQQTF